MLEKGLKSIEEILEILKTLKSEDKKIVTMNGCFDILHLAHTKILEEARKHGDVLIVLLNGDSSIKKYKGEKRPIIPQEERAGMLLGLSCVDYVVIFDEYLPLEILKKVKPHIHVKGGTYTPEIVEEEKNLIESFDGEVRFIEEIEGISSTKIIERILEAYRDS